MMWIEGSKYLLLFTLQKISYVFPRCPFGVCMTNGFARYYTPCCYLDVCIRPAAK